jgi:hypothetical protein
MPKVIEAQANAVAIVSRGHPNAAVSGFRKIPKL